MPRITPWLSSFCVLVAGAAQAVAADDYTLYVKVATNPTMADKYGINLENIVNYDDSPFDREGIRVLSAGLVGDYPFAGIHIVEADPKYMERHLELLRPTLARWLEPGYDGVVTIDYETWWASWDTTRNRPSGGGPGDRDFDFLDDWTEYIQRYRPEVVAGKIGAERERALRDSYEEATVRFLVETLRECRRLYPNAKWGYYNYPKMIYHGPLTPPGTIGYGDLTHYASQSNDRLAELWAEVDVTAPRVYALRQTVLDRDIHMRDNTPEQQYIFLATHVHESKRLAPHALCLPFISTRYFAPHGDINQKSVGERNSYMQIAVPRDAGADGVILWGDAMTDGMAKQAADYMNDVAIPIANELWERWYPDGAAARGREPASSGGRAARKPPAGSAESTPVEIPEHVRIRQFDPIVGRRWGAIWSGEGRVSIPSHWPGATSSSAVHRGGRIIGRRSTGYGDSPPQHIPAMGADEPEEQAGGVEQGASGGD